MKRQKRFSADGSVSSQLHYLHSEDAQSATNTYSYFMINTQLSVCILYALFLQRGASHGRVDSAGKSILHAAAADREIRKQRRLHRRRCR
jgi:hypothetical protein